MKAKRKKSKQCEIPPHISWAGHQLKVRKFKTAGKTLATDGKRDKRRRVDAGCEGLEGLAGVIKLKTKRTPRGIVTTYAVPKKEWNKLAKRNAKPIRKGRTVSGGASSGTFRLSAKQKRNLPPQLQRAIIESHRRRGERILD